SPAAARRRAQADGVTVAALQAAIANYEIEIYVQPQMDARSGALHGVEALARWNSPAHGFVPPDRFVALAEEHGLIGDLTELVLKKSLVACSRWNQAGLQTRISVNAPIAAMCDLMLPDTILTQLERMELQPGQLTLEITETGVLQNMERALDVLARLRLRGIGLAIDDFGCGHSTFQQLRRLPFSELKVDCSFVMKMLSDRDAHNIVRSCLDLARDLELQAVAEGVETQQHWDALAQMGCPLLQGYHIAKPFPAAQLPAWLRQRKILPAVH
ncbi:MAG TPA: EAL domain-containing protein, partial [Solimonas sp.]|nr:EAL domain-containing protein [Solimonas sp.]